jgi:hypothetical protein
MDKDCFYLAGEDCLDATNDCDILSTHYCCLYCQKEDCLYSGKPCLNCKPVKGESNE